MLFARPFSVVQQFQNTAINLNIKIRTLMQCRCSMIEFAIHASKVISNHFHLHYISADRFFNLIDTPHMHTSLNWFLKYKFLIFMIKFKLKKWHQFFFFLFNPKKVQLRDIFFCCISLFLIKWLSVFVKNNKKKDTTLCVTTIISPWRYNWLWSFVPTTPQ